jgi:hypothetical protein
MTPIYYLNIAASILLLFWPMWFARTQLRLPWISPFSIVLMITLPVELMKLFVGPLFLIEGGLFDIGYQYALLMASLLALTQAAGAVFFFRFAKSIGVHRYLPFKQVSLGRRDMRRGAGIFLLIFCLALFALANAEYGVVNWLLNPRMGYQFYRTGQGHWYALATSALSVSFVLAFLARPTAGYLLLNLIVYLGMGYFLGSKAVLLTIFTSALVFLWFLRWRHLGKLMLVGAPLLFGLLIVNLYLALGEVFELGNIIGYFDHFMNAANYYRGYLNNEIDLFHGEVIMSSLWTYVPRVLWPDKPTVYGILHINEIFYPGLAGMTYTPAFGGAVEQHADFGPLGVVVLGFFSSQAILTGLFSYLIFRRPGLRLDHITLATVLLILVQYAPSFGTFIPGGLYLLLLFAVLAILRMLRRSPKRIARSNRNLLQNGGPTPSETAQS